MMITAAYNHIRGELKQQVTTQILCKFRRMVGPKKQNRYCSIIRRSGESSAARRRETTVHREQLVKSMDSVTVGRATAIGWEPSKLGENAEGKIYNNKKPQNKSKQNKTKKKPFK